jgi:hypothetical protein
VLPRVLALLFRLMARVMAEAAAPAQDHAGFV